MMSVEEVADAVLFIATQPPHLNVLELLMLPTGQAYLGRG
jgi:NADP-dependent 3-hydroxy acid dehydrogenase YdfG